MELSRELAEGLDTALNEADFCDMRIGRRKGEVRLLFQLLTLPEVGPEPDDRRRVLVCSGVSRIIASLSEARLNEQQRVVKKMNLSELAFAVRSFGSQPVYGWEFLDLSSSRRGELWRDHASLDISVGRGRGEHSIDLFQENPSSRLDLRIEFDELAAKDENGKELALDELVAGGRRWWAAFAAGDPRTAGHGISRAHGES